MYFNAGGTDILPMIRYTFRAEGKAEDTNGAIVSFRYWGAPPSTRQETAELVQAFPVGGVVVMKKKKKNSRTAFSVTKPSKLV